MQTSIFEHIKAHININGTGLLPGGEILPDEDEYDQDMDIRWAPGARDIIGGDHSTLSTEEINERVNLFIEAFRKATSEPSQSNIDELEEVLSYQDTLSIIDNVLRRLVVDTKIDQSVLYRICRHLFFTSRKRGVVKFCIAIMGLFSQKQDVELFKMMARHEEFTLYSIVAVIDDPNTTANIWLEMAKHVTGWGKVHLVSHLVDVNRDDVKDYLLREGCKNDIMEEYSAAKIARAIDLAKVLKSETIDRGQYEGAGVILSALVNACICKGPYDGLDRYRDGSTAILQYLRHSKKMAVTLDDFLRLDCIKKTTISENQGGCREKLDYDPETLKKIETIVNELLEHPQWKEVVLNALDSEEPDEQYKALQVANILDFPITEKIFIKIEKDPQKPYLWYFLMQRADANTIDKIIDLAIKKLISYPRNLTAVPEYLADHKHINYASTFQSASENEPKKSGSIILPANNSHRECLNIIVRELDRFPGKGWEIIRHFLESPSDYDRNVAIKVLQSWDSEMIKEHMLVTIERLLNDEDELVKIGAENLLRKL